MTTIYNDKNFSFVINNQNSLTITNNTDKPYIVHSTWPNKEINLNNGEYVCVYESGNSDTKAMLTILDKKIQAPLTIPAQRTMIFKINLVYRIKKEKPTPNIYLLMAIQPTFINLIKFLLCLSIQLSISPLIIYNYIMTEYTAIFVDKSITFKVVACLVSLNIIFNFQKAISVLTYPSTSLQKLHHNGSMLKEINMFYYLTGYYVNLIITIFSFVSAVFIVFTADSPLRIILSGFAVTAVNNIDDQIITPQDTSYITSVLGEITDQSVRKIPNLYRPISSNIISIISNIAIVSMLFIPIYILIV